jgi:capsular exopolysaccharide synthesis family protein
LSETTSKSDLSKIVKRLRRHAPLILVCAIVAGAAAWVVAHGQPKKYTARATILFRSAQQNQAASGLQVVTDTDPQARVDQNLVLASLPSIKQATARALNGSAGSLDASVAVAQVSDTGLVAVAATASSPQRAARVANVYSAQVIGAQRSSNATYYRNALRAVQLQYASLTPGEKLATSGVDLKDRIASLQILSSLQGDGVQVVQAALPPSVPSSPRVTRDVAIGVVLGLLLGLVVAVLRERLNLKLREPGDVEEAYRLPLIGVIPDSRALTAAGSVVGRTSRGKLSAADIESFSLLRVHLRSFNVDRDIRMLMVASAMAAEGKSTISRNLAAAAATAGSRVLLLELDLRRPTVSTQLGVEPSPGVTDVLIGTFTLAEAIQSYPLEIDRPPAGFDNDGGPALDVLVAGGSLPVDPVQMMESHAMQRLLDQLRESYDLIVVDTPPMAILADAFPLLPAMDGVMIVARLGHARRDVAERLRKALVNASAPTLGVVANGLRQREGSAEGYYAHTYYAERSADRPQPEQESGVAELTVK